jgi:hypothetical protein
MKISLEIREEVGFPKVWPSPVKRPCHETVMREARVAVSLFEGKLTA